MWHRDEAKPTQYHGILFRSASEARVAEQLDTLGVQWKYEVPAHEALTWMQAPHANPPEPIDWYLPDFTILDAPEYLELPLWVEVKPAELLYALRDHVGCSERFEGIHRADISARTMHDAQLTEIWKPALLAERTQRDVLVVSAINRNRTLSLLMRGEWIELTRSHPAVNHRQLLAEQEREERWQRQQQEWERQRVERQAETNKQATQIIEYAKLHGRAARFNGWCQLCHVNQAASALVIFRSADDRWVAICRIHLEDVA